MLSSGWTCPQGSALSLHKVLSLTLVLSPPVLCSISSMTVGSSHSTRNHWNKDLSDEKMYDTTLLQMRTMSHMGPQIPVAHSFMSFCGSGSCTPNKYRMEEEHGL
jgi:hypothetical protein